MGNMTFVKKKSDFTGKTFVPSGKDTIGLVSDSNIV